MSRLPLEVEVDLATFFNALPSLRSEPSHTHHLHPYPAKFIPEIPRALIQNLARPGGIVMDPMCGSGTTLVEAAISQHPAVGVDLNPVAALISRAKTTPLGASDVDGILEIQRRVAEVSQSVAEGTFATAGSIPDFRNRDKWFETQALTELALILELVGDVGGAARDLALATFSSIIVRASNQESETRWAAKAKEVTPGRVLKMFADRLTKTTSMVASLNVENPASVSVYQADARSLPIASQTVDLVVTSPPYANSHDYYLYNKLRLFWLGHDVRSLQDAEIGSRNKISDRGETIEDYMGQMEEVLSEVHRVLTPGGAACFVVSDAVVRGELHDMRYLYETAGQSVGLSLHDRFDFAHQRLNRTFQAGFGTSQRKMTHVLVFRS